MGVNKSAPVAAIVLAAGISQRMGKDNKLHLTIDGKPLLRHSLETLCAANLGEIVVVLGHEHEATHELLDGLPIKTVFNKDYLSGQMSSMRCGLSTLSEPNNGVMVALGDQPALTSEDINVIIDAYHHRDYGEVVIPMYQGERGNPIVISANSRDSILAGEKNVGCKQFIKKHPELTVMVEMPNSSVLLDLDTPQEYQAFCESTLSDSTRLRG